MALPTLKIRVACVRTRYTPGAAGVLAVREPLQGGPQLAGLGVIPAGDVLECRARNSS